MICLGICSDNFRFVEETMLEHGMIRLDKTKDKTIRQRRRL